MEIYDTVEPPDPRIRRTMYNKHMRVTTGKVVDGKVVVEGEALDEGSAVTVFLPEADEEIVLTPEEEAELQQAVREADQGDFIDSDAEQFLDELDRRL